MTRTIEIVEQELAEARQATVHLMEHIHLLAEAIRHHAAVTLPHIKELNLTYQRHATFMAEIEKGMTGHEPTEPA